LVLVWAVATILRRALPGRSGTIAVLVFVLSGIHAMFCWTAARHVLIAAALGFAGLVAHLRWRADGWRPGALLAPAALATSLAAREVGVAVACYLLAYECLASSGPAAARRRAAMPTVVVLTAWVVVWTSLGYGVSTASGYVDPLRDPLGFAAALPPRLAVLL